MKKSTIIWIAVGAAVAAAAVGALLFFSGGDVRKYVPKDAWCVATVDCKTLAKKADLVDLSKYISEKSSGAMGELMEQGIQEFLENPLSLGIDFTKDIITAVYPTSDLNPVFECIIPLSSVSDFEKSIINEMSISVKEKDGISYSYIDDSYYGHGNEYLIAWNDDVAIGLYACGETQGKSFWFSEAKRLLNLEKSESLLANDNFSQYWKNRTEAGVYLDTGNILNTKEISKELRREMGSEYLDNLMSLYGNSAEYATIDFAPGKLLLHAQAINVDLEQFKNFLQPFNLDLLDYMPSNVQMIASGAVNIKEVWKEVQSMIPYEYRSNGDWNNIQDVIKSLGGSFVATLEGSYNPPRFSVAVDCSDPRFIRNLLDQTYEKNYYDGSYIVDKYDKIFAKIEDNALILFNEYRYGPFGLKNHTDEMQHNNLFAYMDLNLDKYSLLSGEFSYGEKKIWNRLFESVTLESNSEDGSMDVTVSVPSGKQNSLNYALKVCVDTALELKY